MTYDLHSEVELAIGELSRLLITEGNLTASLQRVANLAVDVIPACDCCGVSVSSRGKVSTSVATSKVAERVDSAQYRVDDGPCLTAIRVGETVKVDDVDEDDRWPGFAQSAKAEGVRSSSSVPLRVDANVVGALNLYSQSEPFGPDDDRVAEYLADHAAVTLANAAAYDRLEKLVTNLRIALDSRDVIGQAKGILMERQRVTADAAFERLRALSQKSNVKVHDIARQIAETGTWDGDPPPTV